MTNHSLIPMSQITSDHLETINKQYERIDLIKQGITDADINLVVNEAIINKQCQKLFLSRNNITSTGSSIIAQALNNNHFLKLLALSYNNLSDEGVQFLTKILAPNNSELQTLSLHATGITDNGVRYLVDMLKTNTTLTWLHLGRNKISNQGIELLTDALIHHNKTLKALELSHNVLITDAAVDSLVEMIKLNKSLETLWINDCKLSSKGKEKLQQIVQSNQRFFLLFV
jgi:Ran GTPase-activating protein (RanGAP) involved in mRNA processing and transport